MRRVTPSLVVLALVAALALLPGTSVADHGPQECGLTTLDATIHLNPATGLLECGPGQELVVREDLGALASPDRATQRRPLASWINIADVQLADEESPVRGEWADKCGQDKDRDGKSDDSPISNSAWRPHEAFVPHLLNGHIKAADAIAEAGSPVLGDTIDFVVGLGDLADNQQLNEIRQIIDLFDGRQLVDTDSGNDPLLDFAPYNGGDGYHGVQAQDPDHAHGPNGEHTVTSPVTGQMLLDLANEPFWAEGLHHGGAPIPWYSLPGNHDVKVQGTIPDDNPAWQHLVRRYATGHVKLMDLAPDYQSRLCRALREQDQAEFQQVMTEIFSNPERAGTTKVVPSDPDRMLLYRSDEAKGEHADQACAAETAGPVHPKGHPKCGSSWIEEHFETTGLPVGHGYEGARCNDGTAPLERACYSFTHGQFHFVAVDTNPAEGLEGGNIDSEQFAWIERELQANSTRYFDESGRQQTKAGEDKLIVVLTHHTIASTDNKGTISSVEDESGRDVPGSEALESDAKTGEDLKQLLLRYPNVIMQASGHTHDNRIYAHKNSALGTGYWEINTSAIADVPIQSRTIEVADNGDGTLSIFAVVFDALVPADVRTIDWAAHDHTHETELAVSNPKDGVEVKQNVNEDWLASFGREAAFYDPQQDLTATGAPGDRNVELLIRAPFDLTPETATVLTYTGPTSGKVGKTIDASAILTTADGSPVEGMTVTFARTDGVATAVTDANGVASALLEIGGPPGSGHPITVSFAGSFPYLASSIEVPFTATTGKK